MGKRKAGNSKGGNKNKKFRVSGFIDPNTSGIYATCNRGKEQQCRKELINLFSDKAEEYFNLDELNEESDAEKDDKDLSIEEKIQKELNDMQDSKGTKKEILKPIDLGCECLVFIKTRRPIEPATFVERICEEFSESKSKTTRYTQKLSPITFSVTPTMEEVKKLAERVLGPHFHNKNDQKPYKFAIQVSKRNFNTLQKPEIIKAVAESVGRDHGHSVDLKNYDKLIMVECYKSNIGMSVVNNYDRLERFNLQQIFEKSVDSESKDRNQKSEIGQVSDNSVSLNKENDQHDEQSKED